MFSIRLWLNARHKLKWTKCWQSEIFLEFPLKVAFKLLKSNICLFRNGKCFHVTWKTILIRPLGRVSNRQCLALRIFPHIPDENLVHALWDYLMYVQKCQVIPKIRLVWKGQIFKACTYHKICSQLFSKCWWPSDFIASTRTENSSSQNTEKGLETLEISKKHLIHLRHLNKPFCGNSVKIYDCQVSTPLKTVTSCGAFIHYVYIMAVALHCPPPLQNEIILHRCAFVFGRNNNIVQYHKRICLTFEPCFFC